MLLEETGNFFESLDQFHLFQVEVTKRLTFPRLRLKVEL